MTLKQSNFTSIQKFSRCSLTSVGRSSLNRLVVAFVWFALVSTVVSSTFGQTLISRNSHLNFNYVFGAGPDVFQDTQELTASTLNLSDIHSIGHAQSESGSVPAGPWSAGISVGIQQQYSITGTAGLLSGIEASGASVGDTSTSGFGSAGLFSSNPGNSLILNFDLTQAQVYSLTGEIAFVGGASSTQTAVALQRWDGIVWQNVHNSLFLSGNQGAFDWSGTLDAGQYRMFSGLNLSLPAGN
jgi:hypothetical protein